LDAYDDDPAVFFQYLIAGFQQFLPNFGKEAMTIIKQGDFQSNLRLILGKFINSLAQSKEKISLVLDDFQVINEPVIHRFIQEFLERLPENVRLLIASRTTWPLSLSRLTAAGEILLIDSNELRFNRDEIKEYLASGRQDPTESFIDHIESNTNGWPVALSLTKAFMDASQTNILSQGTKEIYTYLAGEVLANQPEIIRDFLIATSVLDELTPEYCDSLLEQSDSLEILGYLEKQQLFLTVLEGKTDTYRYHHLFREFLRSRLGNKRRDLMRRAGLIACESGEFDRAIANFISAGLEAEAVATIEEAAKPSLQQGRWLTVSRWLDSLSSTVIAANSWLSLYRAQVELYRNRFGEKNGPGMPCLCLCKTEIKPVWRRAV
jgi:LuxR family maltose regulon positive regulatory protein